MTKLLKDSNERWYGICLKHKQIMNEENLKKHRKKGCQVVISEFKHRYKHKINKHWAAKSVAEKHGMKIYKHEKREPVPLEDTLPADAVTLDYIEKVIDLDDVD